MVTDDADAAEAGEAAPERCATHPKQRVLGPCEGCGRPLCYQCAVHGEDESAAKVQERAMRCAACTAESERPQAANVPKAAVFGAVGALIGAAIWATVRIYANAEVGYIAWGIGGLAGFGVVLGARPSRGKPYQIASVACALGGLVIGKFWGFAGAASRLYEKESGEPWPHGLFSAEMLEWFNVNLSNELGPFDLLWLFLAVATAWQLPASSVSRVAVARASARTRRRASAAAAPGDQE